MSEFASSYTEGVAELELSLPRANVVRYQAEHFDAAYGQLQALANRGERDAKFLVSAVPLVLNRVSRNRQDAVQKDILALARQFQVINCAPVVLAVLSVLYEEIDGKSSSIGRKLLKPTAAYSPEDAYNAVSDLRHIELAALSHAVLPEQAFALCTNDRGIAAFWSALKFRGKATEDSLLNLYYSLGTDLFPRLCQDEVNAVAHALRE